MRHTTILRTAKSESLRGFDASHTGLHPHGAIEQKTRQSLLPSPERENAGRN